MTLGTVFRPSGCGDFIVRIVCHGLSEDADIEALIALIHAYTGIGHRAAREQVGRLDEDDAVILKINAERVPHFIREATRLGVEVADLLADLRCE